MPHGTRAKVIHGNAQKTSGGLTKKDLKYNKRGKIVSVVKSHPLRGKLKADEFYCVACRNRCKASDIKHAKARKTGNAMLKGYCNKCENKVAKFVKS